MTRSAREPWTASALAPAKVNLTLEILGRRADGYHELRTTMVALDLADRVRVRRTASGLVKLALSGPQHSGDVPAGAANLAFRAAEAVLAIARARGPAGPATGLAIELEKRIPSQAGLGGASSDAAAAVLACAEVLGCELGQDERDSLLATLGSDCVFFARAAATGFALCEGRGERVTPASFPWPGSRIAVVTPDVVSPTKDVYAALALDPRRAAESGLARTSLPEGALEQARRLFFNDLEAPALAAIPGLRAWRELLDGAGASDFRLSGSGSSFFGTFSSEDHADRALAAIRREAQARGRTARGAWTTRPGAGARLLGD